MLPLRPPRPTRPAAAEASCSTDDARVTELTSFIERGLEVSGVPGTSVGIMTIVPGLTGLEFVVGEGEEKTLIMRDAQHEYVFDAI